METLSAAAYVEKNALSNTGAWLYLLEIVIPSVTTLYICNNTENVDWPTAGGNTYVAFPFEFDEVMETSKGEVPQLNVRVGNASRALQSYLEQANGGVGSTVTLSVVHSDHLDLTTAEIELAYEVMDVTSDSRWVTFVLGSENIYKKQVPRGRIMKNVCRYREFGGDRCGFDTGHGSYDGNGCNRSLARCVELFAQITAAWSDTNFSVGDLVSNDETNYICTSAVTSGNSGVTEPGDGSAWDTYWRVFGNRYGGAPGAGSDGLYV